MTRTIFLIMMLAVGLTTMATSAIAQEPILVNYQGQLTDSTGNPVPDSSYEVAFSIYDDSTGGTQLWSEAHPSVQTLGGLFSVQLGSIDPLDLATLGSGPLFLQIQIGSDPPMRPRTRLTLVPQAAIAQRVMGDIETGLGSLVLKNSDGDSAICLLSDGIGNTIKVNWAEPMDRPPAIELNSISGTASRLWMYHPLADPPGPMIEINADPTAGSSIIIHSAEPLLGGSVDIRGTPTSGGIITLNTNPAPHEEIKVIEMSSASPNGGTIKMFNSQLEPPPVLMEMSTSFNARELGASLVMFNPQPEPPGNDPFIEMHTYDLGGSFNMYGPQVGRETQLFLEIKADSTGASIKLFDTSGGTTVEISNNGDIEAKRGNFGSGNTNTGATAFVAGTGNSASGDYSFAAGRFAKANHQGSMVWADATGDSLASSASNQFLCRASGGTQIYSSSNMRTGVILNPGSSQWEPILDRDSRRNIRPVDGEEILDKLEQLPISRWSYKTQDPGIEHIGPMAQDFWRLFHLGEDSLGISTIDPDGIALAAIQQLRKENQQLREELNELRSLVETIFEQQGNLNNIETTSIGFVPDLQE